MHVEGAVALDLRLRPELRQPRGVRRDDDRAVPAALQVVEDLTEEQVLEPAGGLALQDKTKDVVELGKLDDFTVLDSRACVLADMVPLENGDRDALHSTTDKLLKELQRERC